MVKVVVNPESGAIPPKKYTLLERILNVFPYVKGLLQKIEYAEYAVDMYEENQKTLINDVANAKDETRKLKQQHEHDLDIQKQLADAHQEALEEANDDIRVLTAELLEWRKKYPPQKPEPSVKPPIARQKQLKTWRCSCPRVHTFYEVACPTCSRTRPAIPISSPPSA